MANVNVRHRLRSTRGLPFSCFDRLIKYIGWYPRWYSKYTKQHYFTHGLHLTCNDIIIIIISIFKEDSVFSITASLPYGPPVNADIDYYRTFFRLVYFCKCCEVSCGVFC